MKNNKIWMALHFIVGLLNIWWFIDYACSNKKGS